MCTFSTYDINYTVQYWSFLLRKMQNNIYLFSNNNMDSHRCPFQPADGSVGVLNDRNELELGLKLYCFIVNEKLFETPFLSYHFNDGALIFFYSEQ